MLTKEMMEKFISKLQHVMLNRNNSINKAMTSNRVVGRDFLNTFILYDGKNKIYKKKFYNTNAQDMFILSVDVIFLSCIYCIAYIGFNNIIVA